MYLKNRVDRLRMNDNDTIAEFIGRLSEIAEKSSALGEEIDEPKKIKKFLSSLPSKRYIQIVASLEQLLDLNTSNYEDIVGRLKVYEERINAAEKETHDQPQNKLMYANTDGQTN